MAASRFQARSALKKCERFAAVILTRANCLRFALISKRCNLLELGEKAFIRCLAHFEFIIQEPQSLSLDDEFLMKLISDDRLKVSNEIIVFEFIIKWMKFDESQRSNKLERLMDEVRFASIDSVSLTEPRIESLVGSSK